jgi:putative transposase
VPWPTRFIPGDLVCHVINRGNGRANALHKPGDPHFADASAGFAAFVRILAQASELMSNHFRLVVRPRRDGNLQAFMQWATTCHVRRYHVLRCA